MQPHKRAVCMQPATGVSFLQKAIFKYQSFIHVLQGCGMGKKVPPRIWMFMRDVDKFLLHVWGVYYFYYTIWGCIYILLGCFYYTADGVLIWTLNWILKRKAGVHIYRIRIQSSWLWVDKILICYCFCVWKKILISLGWLTHIWSNFWSSFCFYVPYGYVN